MPVVETADEKALKARIADLKVRLNGASLANDHLSRELGTAQKALAKVPDFEAELAAAQEKLNHQDTEIKRLNAELNSANAALSKADGLVASARQIAEGIKALS
jgi:uncharacterized phage infection (PIP) family protein YhgE